jgi:hypothetical protein
MHAQTSEHAKQTMTAQHQRLSLKEQTICVVTPVSLAGDSRTLKQVCTLRRLGANVVTFAAGTQVPEDLASLHAAPPTTSGAPKFSPIRRLWVWVRTTRLPAIVVAPFFFVWLCLFLAQTIRLSWKLPDASLFVLHGVTSYPAFALSGRRAPFIYDIHDFYCGVEPTSEIGTFERAFLRPFLRFIETRCLAKAAGAVTVSDGLATLIQDSYGRRPVVIRNCHDHRLDEDLVPDLRTRLNLDDGSYLVVVIGNHKPGQHFGPFFEALGKSRKRVHVALIGRGYEALIPQLEAAGLKTRVHIVGALAPWSIVPSVRSANLAALPYYGRSDNYSFSLPNGFFQSVGAALPLLYPDLPEMSALAKRLELGMVVDWSSPKDIESKITAFESNRDLQAHYRASAQAGSTVLSWQSEEEPWLKLLERALKVGHQSTPASARL